ncbi:MAG TPA: hypothetical protein PL151_00010 [Phycisphaerae bacterium]|nr:hypothetical protein [Phycisphaerae bacterium]HOJ76018.1 hypothetical protein [Phycisphaerae bacterium]HOM52787.1 hypothetical protein [Phycisphaerae bacterium]HOQ86783.1 hypothetical protein [Phycisphaerae bacterium]HPP28584.1 hypothetical protein [Phycisphaerae bacterium]
MRSHAISCVLSAEIMFFASSLAATSAEIGRIPNGFDAAPFGERFTEDDGKIVGIRWGEPRKIRQLILTFKHDVDPASIRDAIRVEYWHHNWNGKADPVADELDAGATGWADVDDWYNGNWRKAETILAANNREVVIHFPPTGPSEGYKNPHIPGVAYRKTLKIRLASDSPLPELAKLEAITEAVCRPLTVRISFDEPADAAFKSEPGLHGRFEAFNGSVNAIRKPGDSAVVDVNDFPLEGELLADVTMTVDPVDSRYDRTIVTLRAGVRSFSFAADEVARGDRIFVDDLGVLVTRGDDEMNVRAYRQHIKQLPGKTVYHRIFEHPEQTLDRAWNDMPLKRQIMFVHGLPGDRNVMGQGAGGDIRVSGHGRWFALNPSPRDSARQKWDGQMLWFDFGLPDQDKRAGRELKDGYLPLLRSCWQDGPIFYEQLTVLDTLTGKLDDIPLDEPTVLLMQLRVLNTTETQPGTARLRLIARVSNADREHPLVLQGNRVFNPAGPGEQRFRYLFETHGKGRTASDGKGIDWSLELAPGESHKLFVAIPSITLETDEEIEPLAHRDFHADAERICRFWRELTERGTQIITPEPWLNDFHKAHLRHMLINCQKELDSDRLHAHVGTFYYGMYPNESAMMVSDLDRRGYHDEARRNIDSMLHYQGTVQFAGTYTSKEGLLYGDGGHETGDYNKSHGYILWLIAHHWRMTRDRVWLEASADKIVKACEWIVHERRTTMKTRSDGSKPIEYGCLPAGGLEDVQDFWFWLATNAATDWGFQAAAAALADINHPRAGELQKEAAAYHHDFMAAMTEARIRTPVVRLRDGRYVPKYPSELYTRGRAYGWLREVLEGSLFLPAYQLLDPNSPEARWIMQDYEDNLYISRQYSYDIPNFGRFWFSRGGFCMQACLLDSPLPYLWRDEIKHYVRAYFNSFASGFYPETRMLCEHALPELGYWRGDHFKSSDEAQSTYWLRLMFVREEGSDLYLGQAIPRYWLADGRGASIERAASEFGPLSLAYQPDIAAGRIKATLVPPTRNAPETIYLRFRHPEEKRMTRVTVNGQPYDRFDAEKEWVILPGALQGVQEVTAEYR